MAKLWSEIYRGNTTNIKLKHILSDQRRIDFNVKRHGDSMNSFNSYDHNHQSSPQNKWAQNGNGST